VEQFFEKFGALYEVWLARSAPMFAFVVFKSKSDAYDACVASDGADMCGRKVRVTIAKPRIRRGGRAIYYSLNISFSVEI